jgi:pimeloyl-ACP methyl ester carboxylesterase
MLHALLEKGGEQPPYLMAGHSFGGVYVRTFTADYPGEVVGMVLVDSSHDDQNQRVPAEFTELPDYEKLQTMQLASLRVLQIAEPIGLLRAFKLMDPWVDSLQLAEEDEEPVLAQAYRSGYMGPYVRETLMMSDYAGLPTKLGDIPLIVLSQKVDAQKMYEQYRPLYHEQFTMEMAQQLTDSANEMQDELAALSRRGVRIVVEDSGHFIQLDAPEVVIDAIQEVFEQVAR